MDFIRELLDESKGKKKKGPTRVARHAVYHADYLKTKNKPYRKYHKDGRPMTEGDELEFSGDRNNMDVDQSQEDMPQDDMSQDQDFAADEFGGEEGGQEGGDIAAELERIIADLSELLDQYDAEQGGEEQPEGGEEQPEEQLPDDIEGQDQEYPEETPGDQEEKQFSPQFSSWLQKMSGVDLKEYAPSTMFPKTAVSAPIVKAAKPCCLYKKQAAAKVKEIAGKFSKEADVTTALATIKKVAIKHHQNGGKHGERIYNILSKHMSK
jgi:hypothetical protein